MLQCARFFEKVGRPWNHLNTALRRHSGAGLSIQFEDHPILATDDHQRRHSHAGQRLPGEVRTAAPKDDRTHRT